MATILITGCSSGFGMLTAVAFARDGHRVFATMRDVERAGPLRDAAGDAASNLHVVALDVCDPASVGAAVDHVVADAGGLDVVVNNAGIEIRGPVEQVSDAEMRRQFDTNVFGLLHVVRAVVPHLEASDDGVLVNVSSIAGLISRPFAGAYAASKHAVEALSEALHFELGLKGVRVHIVEPGQFATQLGANTITAAAFDPAAAPYGQVSVALDEKVRGLVPDGEPADPAAVAQAILAVAGDPAAPLRVLVGGDAELIAAARSGSSFEDYEVTMRTFLDYWEGYRRDRR